jgi:hypothetical protein
MPLDCYTRTRTDGSQYVTCKDKKVAKKVVKKVAKKVAKKVVKKVAKKKVKVTINKDVAKSVKKVAKKKVKVTINKDVEKAVAKAKKKTEAKTKKKTGTKAFEVLTNSDLLRKIKSFNPKSKKMLDAIKWGIDLQKEARSYLRNPTDHKGWIVRRLGGTRPTKDDIGVVWSIMEGKTRGETWDEAKKWGDFIHYDDEKYEVLEQIYKFWKKKRKLEKNLSSLTTMHKNSKNNYKPTDVDIRKVTIWNEKWVRPRAQAVKKVETLMSQFTDALSAGPRFPGGYDAIKRLGDKLDKEKGAGTSDKRIDDYLAIAVFMNRGTYEMFEALAQLGRGGQRWTTRKKKT